MKKNTQLIWVAFAMVFMVSCRKDIMQNLDSSINTNSLQGGMNFVPSTYQGEISKKVKIGNPTGGDSLLAWLFIPATSVDVPAVVVLHGSGGLWKPGTNPAHSVLESQFAKWIDIFRSQKIAALFVDSYVSRGIPGNFTEVKPPDNFHVAAEFVRPRDAYSGLAYLRAQNKIIDNKIGLLGFSHGGTSAVSAMVDSAYVHKSTWTVRNGNTVYSSSNRADLLNPTGFKPQTTGFVAAVSYYPGLGFYSYYGRVATPSDGKYRSYAPIMIHGATADKLYNEKNTNADKVPEDKNYRVYTAFTEKAVLNGSIPANGNAITMHTYLGANHSFDGTTGKQGAIQADKDADALAKTRTLNFLKPYLGL